MIKSCISNLGENDFIFSFFVASKLDFVLMKFCMSICKKMSYLQINLVTYMTFNFVLTAKMCFCSPNYFTFSRYKVLSSQWQYGVCLQNCVITFKIYSLMLANKTNVLHSLTQYAWDEIKVVQFLQLIYLKVALSWRKVFLKLSQTFLWILKESLSSEYWRLTFWPVA